MVSKRRTRSHHRSRQYRSAEGIRAGSCDCLEPTMRADRTMLRSEQDADRAATRSSSVEGPRGLEAGARHSLSYRIDRNEIRGRYGLVRRQSATRAAALIAATRTDQARLQQKRRSGFFAPFLKPARTRQIMRRRTQSSSHRAAFWGFLRLRIKVLRHKYD